jgi:hypothetical protein
MGSVRTTVSLWCDRGTPVKLAAVLVVIAMLGAAELRAQSVSPSEREALDRIATEAAAKGLPSAPLANKIQEGIAKGYPAARIEPVIRQLAAQLETAEQLLRELDATATGAARDAAITLLAESLGSGLTTNDIRELRRQTQATERSAVSGESIASAARGLGYIREARLPVTDGTGVMAAAVRQGFRPYEVLDLGREIKRRERDFIAGRATLNAVRDAIARGDRPEQVFRERPETERPAATRPLTPERPTRPERPARPERPERPERPARPQ